MIIDNHESLSLFGQLTARDMPPIARFMELTQRDQMFRAMFLGLQLRDGVSRGVFGDRFGLDPTVAFDPMLAHLVELGCVEVTEDAVGLTSLGRTFAEDVTCFVIDSALRESLDGQPRMPHGVSAASAKVERLAN